MKKKMDPEEFKVLLGDIESSPMFPECGEVYRCTVLNGNAPDRFWVQPLDENTVKLRTTMEAVLKQLYSPLIQLGEELDSEIRRFGILLDVFIELSRDSEGSVESFREIIDDYLALLGDYGILFLPEEKTFHRVEIVPSSDYESEQKVAVYLIDEGCFSIAPFQFIWPMSKKLVEYPRFAMCCYLDGVSPHGKVDQQAPVLEWPEDFLIKFKNLLAQNDAWNVQFQELSLRMPQGRFSVTLYSKRSNVNELLYDFGKSRKPTPCAPLEIGNYNPMAAEFYSERNQYDVCVDDPAVALFGHLEVDICERFAKNGYCFKGASCLKQHELHHPSGINLGPVNTFAEPFHSLDALVVDEKYEVSVITVVSLEEIFFILQADEDKYKEELLSLESYINNPVTKNALKKLHVRPTDHEVVLAEIDGVWKRAVCVESNLDTDVYDIRFLDEAKQSSMALSSLRAIEPNMMNVPFISRICRLVNIRASSDATADAVVEKLADLIYEAKAISVKVVSDHDVGCYWAKLLDQDAVCIGSKLVELGLAVDNPAVVPNADKSVTGRPG